MRLNIDTEDCWLELAALRTASVFGLVTAPIMLALNGWIYTDRKALFLVFTAFIYLVGVISAGVYVLVKSQVNKQEMYRLAAREALRECRGCRPSQRVYNQDEDV